MANGYAGKILRINLTTQAVSTIPTSNYEEWLGGAGMGAAIFWDLCTDKTVDAFDPKNVCVMTTGPLCASGTPSCGLTLMVGLGPYTHPKKWFTRSCSGGHVGAQLKYAGYDGIAFEGKAANPVWISIINDKVEFHDASKTGDRLWGENAWRTQELVYDLMTGNHNYPNWFDAGDGSTLQRPAVCAIAQSGENLCRNAAITQNAGGSFSQGGFGAVWGSKNLKAIAVIGTGSVEVADPAALLAARINYKENIGYQMDEPVPGARVPRPNNNRPPGTKVYSAGHLVGCPGCFAPCKKHSSINGLNEGTCGQSHWYITAMNDEVWYKAQDLSDIYALNTNDMSFDDTFDYLMHLYRRGVLGKGKQIDAGDFPFEEIEDGTYAGALAYCEAIALRKGIGDDLAEGIVRAAIKWGRYDEDAATGLLPTPNYGIIYHHTFSNPYWAYAQLMGDRDLNETSVQSYPTYIEGQSIPQVLERWVKKMGKYANNDINMFDCSWQLTDGSNMARAKATGFYSESKARLVAWERYWCYGWMHSLGVFCKTAWSGGYWFAGVGPEFEGFTPDLELSFAEAVLGKKLSFDDVMDVGRKTFLLFRSIYAAQGRVRDDEVFAPWCYTPGDNTLDELEDPGVDGPKFSPAAREGEHPTRKDKPVFNGSTWELDNITKFFVDHDAFEEWKTKFYKLTGLSETTGRPTRATLEAVGMKKQADDLQALNRLG
ncbi:MAG: hypothetical protein FWD43_00870 [Coriobacteriia bacterium]|nr:hypothetical protein [Coriobacteriia bacterium]